MGGKTTGAAKPVKASGQVMTGGGYQKYDMPNLSPLNQVNPAAVTTSNPVDVNVADLKSTQNIDTSGMGQLVSNVGVGNNIQTGIDTSKLGNYSTGVNLGSLPGLISGEALAQDMQRQQDALYQRQAAYLDPQWQQRERDNATMLANQGVVQGSEAWNNAMDAMGRQRSFDYSQARNDAIIGAGQEQSRLFGLGSQARGQLYGEQLNNAQLQNAARQAMFGEQLQAGQFANAAQGQLFNQGLSNAQLANAVRAQQFGEGMSNANLLNDANYKMFQARLGLGQLNQQNNQFNAGARNAAALQAQQLGSAQDIASLNAQNQRDLGILDANRSFDIASQQAQAQRDAAAQAAASSRYVADKNYDLGLRGQRFNELQWFGGGPQIQMPGGAGGGNSSVGNPDLTGLVNSNYAQQVSNANNQNAADSQLIGSAITAAMMMW